MLLCQGLMCDNHSEKHECLAETVPTIPSTKRKEGYFNKAYRFWCHKETERGQNGLSKVLVKVLWSQNQKECWTVKRRYSCFEDCYPFPHFNECPLPYTYTQTLTHSFDAHLRRSDETNHGVDWGSSNVWKWIYCRQNIECSCFSVYYVISYPLGHTQLGSFFH